RSTSLLIEPRNLFRRRMQLLHPLAVVVAAGLGLFHLGVEQFKRVRHIAAERSLAEGTDSIGTRRLDHPPLLTQFLVAVAIEIEFGARLLLVLLPTSAS